MAAKFKPKPPYVLGQPIHLPDFSVRIERLPSAPDKMMMEFDVDARSGRIMVGNAWAMDNPDTIRQITKFIGGMAQRLAPDILLPQAHRTAERVGQAPLAWQISNGYRTLGRCSSKGVIALSYVLMFYPYELREYVICHELAHLTEMNHSARFHEICNAYCHGREAELHSALRQMPLPIPRP